MPWNRSGVTQAGRLADHGGNSFSYQQVKHSVARGNRIATRTTRGDGGRGSGMVNLSNLTTQYLT